VVSGGWFATVLRGAQARQAKIGYAKSFALQYRELVHGYMTLEAWKRAHSAVVLVFRATDRARHPRSFGLFDQLKRAALSVEANIVEGYALGTVPLCRRHLRIALGSAAEAECEARLAKELQYLPGSVVDQIEQALGGAMRAIHGLMISPPVIRRRHGTGSNHAPHTTQLSEHLNR
jgi:four helix bundle protein